MKASLYALDPEAAGFFGARYLHMFAREGRIVGRFGRRGSLKGVLEDSVVRATWHNDVRRGWVVLRFNADFTGFEADYGLDDDPAKPVGHGRGARKAR